jgi:hypothetical protein
LSDQLVRPSAAAAFVAQQKRLGEITYDQVPGATHGTIAGKALPEVLALFARCDGWVVAAAGAVTVPIDDRAPADSATLGQGLICAGLRR